MLKGIRPFRHAASIILASNFRRPIPKLDPTFVSRSDDASKSDWGILTVKRKPTSSFMPSTVVFPGGAIEEADFDRDYASAYESIFREERKRRGDSSNNDSWSELVSKIETSGRPKPPAYEALRSPKFDMAPEWAFRVCALRELFEECGILIGYSLKDRRYVTIDSASGLAPNRPDYNKSWTEARERVRQSARQFATISIREIGIVPAFWRLDDWSNWLAPSVYKQRSRFDTLFYLLCLDAMPEAVVDVDELEAVEWASPKKILEDNIKGVVTLAPPQIYEINRLANFSSSDELDKFSTNRQSQGLIRFYPQLANSADGKKLCILPGDDLYPSDMNEEACDVPLPIFAETAAQLRSKCKNLHRAEFDFADGQYKNPKIYISIPQACGHVSPAFIEKSNS